MTKPFSAYRDSSSGKFVDRKEQLPTRGNTTITSTGTVIRGSQDLANSKGYKDAIEEIRRIRGNSGK